MSSGISSALELSLEAIGPYLTKQNGEKVVQIVAAFCLLGLIYFISLGIYNLYFHPLSSYPGPRLWCAYRFPYWYHTFQGDFPFAVAKHHDAYGPVVRIGPNELSFINEEAWNDIYGFRPGKRQLAKDPWKALPAPDTGVHGLITTPSDADHGRMRRSLTHGFSEKALRDQEALMVVYFDSLISKLKDVATSNKETDMLLWFNFTTFDIIGDLTFGYNFDSLNTGRDWITAISLFVKEQVITDIPRAYPLISWFLKRYVPKELMDVKMAHINNSAGKLDERMASSVVRPDFMSSVLKTYGTETGFTYEELRPTASLLMLAGSETTATTLSAALYFLSTHPTHLKSLTSEIRNTFDTDASITILAVGQMKSLLAVLDETMRMLPPVPSGEFSRVTGKDGDVIAGNFVPPNTSVSVKQWAANHSAANFRDPDLFDPERWLGNERYRGDKRKVVQPFNVGPRACLGRNLAYAEMRVILARVLWNFDFEISDQSLNWMERMKAWNLWEKDPLMMKLKIRE